MKNKKGYFSAVITVALISAAAAALLRPAMKLLYPLKYEDSIIAYSSRYELNEFLVMGIISTESSFDEEAVSHKSAGGLMQLKKETALWCIENLNLDIAEEKIYSPKENIYIGCAYLDYLEDLYGGNTRTALAAYNAGLGNVNKWLSQPRYSDDGVTLKSIPFNETAQYIKKVSKRMEIYRGLYGK